MSKPANLVSLDGHEIRQGGRPFLIAEVAQAHDGSLGFAHAFVDLAAEAGMDAIKFQTHIAEAESTRDETFRVPFSFQDKTRFDYWRRMEFAVSEWEGLASHAREKGLVFLSSCFSVEAVQMMRRVGMPAWKVGSGEVASPELFDCMAEGGEPMLLSTGMSSYEDIGKAVERVDALGIPLVLFQCTSRYPTRLEDVGLNVIDEMHERFGRPVGLSDHSGTIWPSVAAMARGAPVIEVHIAMHGGQFGPDTPASLTPGELAQLVQARDAIHTMQTCPVDKDAFSEEMREMRSLFGKSLALRQGLPAGTELKAEHLTFKKPGGGLARKDLETVVERRLAHDVPADRLLRLDDLEPAES